MMSARNYVVKGMLRYQGVGRPGQIVWSGKDREGDAEALEGTVRSALARALGAELSQGRSTRVGGRNLATKRARSGETFVSLRDWTSARGYRLTTNTTRAVATLELGGRQVIVPLSANTVKVGAGWVSVPGYVREIENVWYVPLDSFERIAR